MSDALYPMVTIGMKFPDRLDVLRPTPGCGDQATYTLIMGSRRPGDMTGIYCYATLGEMLAFANELEKAVHREMAYRDDEAVGC